MAKVETWFPVAIYQEMDLFSHEQNLLWKKHALSIENKIASGGDEWEGGTYTTHSTSYELSNDPVFAPLIDSITSHVNNFAVLHNSDFNYRCLGSWLNISTKENFQELHTHNDSTISAVYYVSASENSGKIVFEDPKEPDMFPLKSIQTKNTLSYTRIHYTPAPGLLLIFRSYLRHLVEPGTNTEPRISIALNFN